MDDKYLNELFGILHSNIRMKIVKLLLKERDGCRFNEISKFLNIYPSTLENHLKKLASYGIITHKDEKYKANFNTEILFFLINKFQQVKNNPYFANHRIAELNSELLNRFLELEYDIITSGISIASKLIDDLKDNNEVFKIGGNVDFSLEKDFMKIIKDNFKDTKIEVILPEVNIKEFIHLFDKKVFFKNTVISDISIYATKKCNLYLIILANSGFLFFPDLDLDMDYENCLYFTTEKSISWLTTVFELLKQNSRLISIKS